MRVGEDEGAGAVKGKYRSPAAHFELLETMAGGLSPRSHNGIRENRSSKGPEQLLGKIKAELATSVRLVAPLPCVPFRTLYAIVYKSYALLATHFKKRGVIK